MLATYNCKNEKTDTYMRSYINTYMAGQAWPEPHILDDLVRKSYPKTQLQVATYALTLDVYYIYLRIML